MPISLKNRVAIVTGAGGGLGRTHALALAARGANVVVNDLGTHRDGTGGGLSPAQSVVEEILAAGGEAVASAASVTNADEVEEMVQKTLEHWDRVDILINNAGVLRDRSFAKMTLEDFRFVVDVHLMGSVNCTKAVWDTMRQQNYGRIVYTTSSSGLYGNFGQSNYGAAKMALVGLMNTLHLEGAKYGIHVNCLAPSAATRMTSDIMSAEALELLDPALVSQGIVALSAEGAPSRVVLCAGGGMFEAAHVTLTQGIFAGQPATSPETILERLSEILDREGEIVPEQGMQQPAWEAEKARAALARPATVA